MLLWLILVYKKRGLFPSNFFPVCTGMLKLFIMERIELLIFVFRTENCRARYSILTGLFAGLIITRPPRSLLLSLGAISSSNAINFRQIPKPDSCNTFTSSLDTVSRFFSRKPLQEYSTVSEKCFTRNAKMGRIWLEIYNFRCLSTNSQAVPNLVFS